MLVLRTHAGFSLVEVLVAISLLLFVVVGSLGVINRSTNSTAHATEEATAFYLAQQGLELVQAKRDALVLGDFGDKFSLTTGNPDPWTTFVSFFSPCITDADATVEQCGVRQIADSTVVRVYNCTNIDNCLLYRRPLSTDPDYYTHEVVDTDTAAGTGVTPFTRTITMELVTAPAGRPRGVMVTSRVTWRTGSLIAGQEVELSTYIANVYDTN